MDIFFLLWLDGYIMISRLFRPWPKYPYTITANQNTTSYHIYPNSEQGLQIPTIILIDAIDIQAIATASIVILILIHLST